ncbi:NUDIX hydrolase [Sphingobacterium prati]|uniref:NUDIX hydrolase n=1 Tax=Sphingobacterium prati TaxID=2737006 RepID=UPI0015533DA6|nr:NUDIX domain-containing protein [Sphingobacterium prati]NPE45992.1 NUDIX domain-containing protein [Sphingobacterium prati]
MTKTRFSAGILLYKFQGTEISFFLVHPGGPFFAKKDEGWWTVPKGEVEDNESELEAAKREFQEETGYLPNGSFIRLNPVKQKGGKIVRCWAVEGDIDPDGLISNNFQMEWPPKSGRIQTFPEIDSGAWFTMEEAKRKINVQQISFLTQLAAITGGWSAEL